MNKVLIFISGFSGSGKSFLADKIQKQLNNSKILSFAKSIKKDVDFFKDHFKKTFNINENNYREEIRPFVNLWGQKGREQDKFFWIKKLEQEIFKSQQKYFIIDDLRLKMEKDYFKVSSFKTIFIRIEGVYRKTKADYFGIYENQLNSINEKWDIKIKNRDINNFNIKLYI